MRAGIVRQAGEWAWTSEPAMIGRDPEESSKPQIPAKDRKFSQMVQALRCTPMAFTGAPAR
jgi:hypothetical protein